MMPDSPTSEAALPPTSGSAFRRISWREAEQLLGGRVDRRKSFYFCDDPEMMDYLMGGPVFEYGEWTTTCSGCTESYMGHYTIGSPERGIGCSECGYTGKRRDGMHIPAKVKQNGEAEAPETPEQGSGKGSDAPTCSACGRRQSRRYMAGVFIGYRCFACETKLNDAQNAVSARALEALSDFEGETTISVKIATKDDVRYAFAKTDDDGAVCLFWNYLVGDEWETREIWLDADTTRALATFIHQPNAI